MIQLLLMLLILLNNTPKIENLLDGASALLETCLFFRNYFSGLVFESVKNNTQEDLAWMTDEAECAVIVALL